MDPVKEGGQKPGAGVRGEGGCFCVQGARPKWLTRMPRWVGLHFLPLRLPGAQKIWDPGWFSEATEFFRVDSNHQELGTRPSPARILLSPIHVSRPQVCGNPTGALSEQLIALVLWVLSVLMRKGLTLRCSLPPRHKALKTLQPQVGAIRECAAALVTQNSDGVTFIPHTVSCKVGGPTGGHVP
jgi:hypothetical protein